MSEEHLRMLLLEELVSLLQRQLKNFSIETAIEVLETRTKWVPPNHQPLLTIGDFDIWPRGVAMRRPWV